tara:strand:+ start:267 stop:395 length:129 start_codon:yes stop_codon:yes gene_type:complete
MIKNIYSKSEDTDDLESFLNVLLTAAFIAGGLNALRQSTQNI